MLTVLAVIGFIVWLIAMLALVLAVPLLMFFDGLFDEPTERWEW